MHQVRLVAGLRGQAEAFADRLTDAVYRFAVRGESGWATYSAVTGVVFVVMFVLSSAGFRQAEGLVDLAGLLQRIAVTVGFGWLALLAVHLFRSAPER
jgi:hypothetical protein